MSLQFFGYLGYLMWTVSGKSRTTQNWRKPINLGLFKNL